jgi:hypothetical protein
MVIFRSRSNAAARASLRGRGLSWQARGWEGVTSGPLPGLRRYPVHFHIRFSRVAGWWNVCVRSLTRIIHDGSSRNRAVAKRDRRAEPRGREASLNRMLTN